MTGTRKALISTSEKSRNMTSIWWELWYIQRSFKASQICLFLFLQLKTKLIFHRCTHLCWASRTSPCRASSGRCATAPWRTRSRWSCTEGSPRRKSCRSSRRTLSPAQWEPAAWRPDAAGYRRGSEARQEHAGTGKNKTELHISDVYIYIYVYESRLSAAFPPN